ncbi:Uncharacterized protein APZ42_031053 [Daphnia magna]|uniref:Uncharacterized protein n=1 Tax=Daphnia magna TaxID=35525 RepID=A0A164N6Z9_9CRUS|nr:Uncharacterized protein APZ42_031053 [Daphnia magna]
MKKKRRSILTVKQGGFYWSSNNFFFAPLSPYTTRQHSTSSHKVPVARQTCVNASQFLYALISDVRPVFQYDFHPIEVRSFVGGENVKPATKCTAISFLCLGVAEVGVSERKSQRPLRE